jgi:hypothetical protein
MSTKKAGRPPKLTQEVEQRIVLLLRSGNHRRTAAIVAGISPSSFHAWMAAGEKSKRGPFARFRRAVLQAEAQIEAQMVGIVVQKATTDVKQAKWWLTHKARKRWGDNQTQKVELSGPKGGPIKVEDARATLDARLAALAAKRSAARSDPKPE